MITNFNQQAADQRMMVQNQMRSLCPQTAELSQFLTTRPLRNEDIPPAPLGSSQQERIDHQMMQADRLSARNAQGLTAVLWQACSQEMATGRGPLPPFLEGR